eukprot:scaffold4597_cov162-Amphora_coffeaeformis.AAC.4
MHSMTETSQQQEPIQENEHEVSSRVMVGPSSVNNNNTPMVEVSGSNTATTTTTTTKPSTSESERELRMSSAMYEEESYAVAESLQEELNEILEAWFEVVTEEDIRAYQQLVEDIRGEQVAERALAENALAPHFTLTDQDGDVVDSKQILLEKQQPIILIFYRGKWCPHCNATLMRYSKQLIPKLQQRARLIAVSPMQPDGTLFLASRRDLKFSVCSDTAGLANQMGITFTVKPHSRPFMQRWGEDVPVHNLAADWDIPVPAVYLLGTDGRIKWSFLDNDPGVRPDPSIVLVALERYETETGTSISTRNALTSPLQEEAEDSSDDSPKQQHDLPSDPVKKSKTKLCNRKCGLLSRMTRVRNRLQSNGRKTRSEMEQPPQDGTAACSASSGEISHDSSGCLSLSPHPHDHPQSSKSRSFRGAQQPPMEFLMSYVFPGK